MQGARTTSMILVKALLQLPVEKIDNVEIKSQEHGRSIRSGTSNPLMKTPASRSPFPDFPTGGCSIPGIHLLLPTKLSYLVSASGTQSENLFL